MENRSHCQGAKKVIRKEMKLIKNALLLGLALVSAASTKADFYRDIDQIPDSQKLLTRDNYRYIGYFNIVSGDNDTVTVGAPYYSTPQTWSDIAGFTPGPNVTNPIEPIEAAFAWFYFRDNTSDERIEAVRIDLDWFKFQSTSQIANKSFSIFGGTANGAITALQIDGILKYQITRGDGDFFFEFARLDVQTDGTNVPDGGATAMLLGFGVLAMGLLRRKLA
jgi:hypothetical protein